MEAPAGPAQVILAGVPLLTFLLAFGHGQERFRARGLIGALVSAGGIAIIFGDQLGARVPLLSLVALLAGAVCVAETGVLVKRFPRIDPVVMNGIAMAVGAAVLVALSVAIGEPLALPARPATWAALAYLVGSSVVIFTLFLFIISRWTASATSYSFLLMPLVTVLVAAGLRGEAVTGAFVAGGALVLVGVYVGALAPMPTAPVPAPTPAAVAAEAAVPVPVLPNCP